jgi:hypothetical protein
LREREMIRQINVRLDNKPGMLGKCVGVLASKGIDIKALEVTDRGGGDFGEVHLIATRVDKAAEVLRDAGYNVEVEEVLVVEMTDRVGFLANILDLLQKKEIDIRYLYAFVSRVEGKSLAVIKVDRPEIAVEVLQEGGVPLLTQKKIDRNEPAPTFNTSIEDHFGGDFFW